MKKLLGLLIVLYPLAVFAQASSNVNADVFPLNEHDSDDTTNVTTFANGSRLISQNGGIWFLESNADRIAFIQGTTITEWPIRSHNYVDPFRSISANPADFEVDGTTVWFIENGNSGIEVQQSIFASLDTTTNLMTEWILPLSKPAGFVREPDGTVWIAMSEGSLVHLNLQTLEVTSYRGPLPSLTFSGYSGIVQGSDGLLYLADFGQNRIVRIDPVALTETAWQTADPTKVQLFPTQPTLDGAGNVFVVEDVVGGGVGRLNLTTGQYDQFGENFLINPTHFFLQGSFAYAVETDTSGGDGRIVVVDMGTVNDTVTQITPVSSALTALSQPAATIRTFTLVPDTFASADDPPDGTVVATVPATGISRFTLPSGNLLASSTSYSIASINGKVWSGVRGALVKFTLLPSGNPTDLVVPIAFNASNAPIHTDFTIFDGKAPGGSLTATFYANPVPPPFSKIYTINALNTVTESNALGSSGLNAGNNFGSLLFTPYFQDVANYQIAIRSYVVRKDGGTYGFTLPAIPVSSGTTGSSPSPLFLAAETSETSIFGLFSPTGATGTATLRGPSGAVRGTTTFLLPENNRQEFNPAASAFGVSPETGDTITFDVSSGTIFPYSTWFEGTGDAAASTPQPIGIDFVAPIAGSAASTGGTIVTEVLLANPDPAVAANVTLAFIPLSASAPATARSVVVPPGGTTLVASEDPSSGLGSLVVHSTSPISPLVRIATRTPAGDFATAAPLVHFPAQHGRFLVSSDARLKQTLFAYNRGAAGAITIQAYDTTGKLVADVAFLVGDHRPIVLPGIGSLVGSGGGRIEYFGSDGTLLYPWLAATDKITGDSDAQLPLNPIP